MQVSVEERKLLSQLAGVPEIVPETDLLGWALAIVSSRAFRVHGETHPGSLLPLIDLCNHSFDANCEVRLASRTSGDVQLISSCEILVGVTERRTDHLNAFLLVDRKEMLC